MYECIQLKQSRLDDRVLEAEDPLDEESDCEEMDLREFIPGSSRSDSDSVTSSTGADGGSPIDIEQ